MSSRRDMALRARILASEGMHPPVAEFITPQSQWASSLRSGFYQTGMPHPGRTLHEFDTTRPIQMKEGHPSKYDEILHRQQLERKKFERMHREDLKRADETEAGFLSRLQKQADLLSKQAAELEQKASMIEAKQQHKSYMLTAAHRGTPGGAPRFDLATTATRSNVALPSSSGRRMGIAPASTLSSIGEHHMGTTRSFAPGTPGGSAKPKRKPSAHAMMVRKIMKANPGMPLGEASKMAASQRR